ncbi:MAG: hypothetical protein KA096_00935 [Bacteroidales bacterium]|nr:hypothetical protein [Bacteroidales bacterium]
MPLNKKLERKFRKTYGIDLLPVGMADTLIADIVEWNGAIGRTVDLEHISLLEFLKIDEPTRNRLKEAIAGLPLHKAAMQQITIDSTFNISGGVDIPNWAVGIGAEIGLKNFISFRIEDVQCRVLGRELRAELLRILLRAKETDLKYYRKKLSRRFIIEELFYAGKVSFEIKAGSTGQLDVTLTKAKIADPHITYSTGGNAIVTCPGDLTVPFAADIEPVKDLMD